jgi:hydrogenase maturation factor
MSKLPRYGKISRDFFDRVIYPNLGIRSAKVLVGPKAGVDTCAIRVGKNRVLVATTDPMSFVSDIGPKQSALESVNLIASDVATSGFPPQFALFDLNLPQGMKDSQFEIYWKTINQECRRLGIVIVGGHTGRLEGSESTVIGAGTMFAIGPEDKYLTSQNGRAGDKVLVTKAAAIATTAILAYAFPNLVGKKIGKRSLEKSKAYLKDISAVRDALTAARAGASAMHDATEGGVLSALYELASASKTGLRVDLQKISVSDETRDVCRIFRIDPYTSLSEGSLIVSCRPYRVARVVSALRSNGIRATVVGELTAKSDILVRNKAGKEVQIKYPIVDPYWQAYYGAKKRGLS